MISVGPNLGSFQPRLWPKSQDRIMGAWGINEILGHIIVDKDDSYLIIYQFLNTNLNEPEFPKRLGPPVPQPAEQ